MLEKLRKGCEWVSLLAVWFGGVLLILCAFLICIEVLMRKLFNVSTGGADEISSYAFAISTSWAFSFAFLRRAHVRVDALYSHLGSPVRAFLDVLALLALTGFGGFLSYYVFFVWRETIILNASANTTLGTPLWLPQGLWMIGFFLFSISLVVVTLECLVALFKRDLGRIHLLAGGRSTAEEIELETDIDRPTHPPERP